MKKRWAILVLTVPAIAAAVMLFWSIPVALISLGPEFTVASYLEAIEYIHRYTILCGVPLFVWIPLALALFATGAWLLNPTGHTRQADGSVHRRVELI